MPERRRIVTLAPGGRVTTLLDIEDGVVMRSVQDTFQVQPGAATPVMAQYQRRYGGSRKVGETHENGTISWTAFLQGATPDQSIALGDSLFALLRDARQDLFFEWRPNGVSQSTFFDVRGPANITVNYSQRQFQQNRMWQATVEIPVGPLARYATMDVIDDFTVDTEADYTFDSGSASDTAVTGGQVTFSANLSTEFRAIHPCGGYSVLDAQATVRATLGTTISSYKAGVALRRSAANNYIDVYVDDNGTNSRLRIDVVIAGSRTNRASVNLATRLATGQSFWVRGRVEGARVYAEAHTVKPGLQSPPAQIAAYTLTSGETSSLPAGLGGWLTIPQQSAATIDDFEYLPFTYSPFAVVAAIPAPVTDDYSTNTIGNYTSDGVSTFSVSGGQLVPAATTEIAYTVTTPTTVMEDVQVTMKYVTGATIPVSSVVNVRGRWIDTNNWIGAQVVVNTNTLQVIIKRAGSLTAPGNATVSTFVHAVSTTYWVRLRIRGNLVVAEWFWTANPPPLYGGVPDAAASYQLSAAEQAVFGKGITGRVGMRTSAMPTDARYDDFDARSLKAGGVEGPEVLRLPTSIPGSAPAMADLTVATAGSGYLAPFSTPPSTPMPGGPPVFAMAAWTPSAQPYNMVWNGDFEEDTNGWASQSAGGLSVGAAGTTARDPLRSKFGTASLGYTQVSSTLNGGPSFALNRRFRAGVPVTAQVWAWAPSSTTSMKIMLGQSGDVATGTTQALTSTPTLYTVTWTPTADREVAYILFLTSTAAAVTCNIDGAMVYEGATAPTGRHAEGAGAPPPFGIIEGESDDQSDRSSQYSVIADPYSRNGNVLRGVAVGAAAFTAGWWVDPNLLEPDDFGDEIDVEFWARVFIDPTNVSPRIILSARPEGTTAAVSGTSVSPTTTYAAERYTSEWGSTGRTLILPTGTNGNAAYRMVRLGTLTFPVDPVRGARWKVRVENRFGSSSAGFWGIDYLLAVPIRTRALTPTGKVLDASYPSFITTPGETTKLITSELRGYSGPRNGGPMSPDSGLGGALIEPQPGSLDMLVKLSSLVPDDPSVNMTSEQLAHPTSVHLAVTPRSHIARGG